MSATPLTVLVPVYSGVEEVRRCLASIELHTPASVQGRPVDVALIEDGSPDAEMIDVLESFAATSSLPVTVWRNETNLGFVRTVNRGLEATDGDVVILNADTVVTATWLDQLAALSRPGVGTITPLTNFGSICTLPATLNQAFAMETDEPRIDDCAEFVAMHSLATTPEVISGVGFCMYVTRAMLDVCGLLDAETFGRGYGEEVDLCLRGSQAGFVHLVADSTFVYHQGGVSFGAERKTRMAAASLLIHQRYPHFRALNTRERNENPLRLTFAALELGLAERDPARPHVLQILHGSPENLGGTEKHLAMLLGELHERFDFSTFFPVEDGFVVRTMWRGRGPRPIEHELHFPAGPRGSVAVIDEIAAASLLSAIDLLQPDAVHIQNLVRHTLAPLEVLESFEGPVVCSVRDFLLACQNHSVLYLNEVACGMPDDMAACARCLPETALLEVGRLTEHRDAVAARLGAVDHWVFASRSAADQFLRAYDLEEDRIDVVAHGAIVQPRDHRPPFAESTIVDEPLRVGFVGRGWPKKGMVQVNELARRLAGTSIEIHHFGGLKSHIDPGIHRHGVYDNEVLPDMLWSAGIQVVLQPAPVPETFSHVLTEAWAAGLPVIGTAYGAVGERIRATGGGWTMDPDDVDSLEALVRALDAGRDEVVAVTKRVREFDFEPMSVSARRYAAFYLGTDPAPLEAP